MPIMENNFKNVFLNKKEVLKKRKLIDVNYRKGRKNRKKGAEMC